MPFVQGFDMKEDAANKKTKSIPGVKNFYHPYPSAFGSLFVLVIN